MKILLTVGIGLFVLVIVFIIHSILVVGGREADHELAREQHDKEASR